MCSSLKGFLPSPFKTNHWLAKILILTPRCAVCLWCILQSLTPLWEAHCGARSTPRCNAHCGVFWKIWCSWLCSVMHTTELDSMVGSTPRCLTLQRANIYFFHFFVFFTSFNNVLQKKVWSKTGSLNNFHINIFRHQREIAFVELWIKTDTWYELTWRSLTPCWETHTAESDSSVWCTPRSQTQQCDETTELDFMMLCTPRSLTLWGDAHCGVRLCSGMHTKELFKNLNILAKSKPNLRIV